MIQRGLSPNLRAPESAGEHFFMTKICFQRLINEADDPNGDDPPLPPGVSQRVLLAAQQVLGAARAAGSIDAELVIQAVVDLLQAAGGHQSA